MKRTETIRQARGFSDSVNTLSAFGQVGAGESSGEYVGIVSSSLDSIQDGPGRVIHGDYFLAPALGINNANETPVEVDVLPFEL
jgi:hypothetical protein